MSNSSDIPPNRIKKFYIHFTRFGVSCSSENMKEILNDLNF